MIVITTNVELKFDDIFEDEMKAATTREDKVHLYKTLLKKADAEPGALAQWYTKKQESNDKRRNSRMLIDDLDEDIRKTFIQFNGKNKAQRCICR